jgi:hypothetical protein
VIVEDPHVVRVPIAEREHDPILLVAEPRALEGLAPRLY